MHDDGPQRLKKQGDAPPSLVRALEALRKGADETARLERVAAKLGPLLDAPPPAAPGMVSGVTSALLRRAAFKLIVGGLALLAPAAWMLRSSQSAKLHDPKRSSEQVAVAKLPDAAVRDTGSVSAAPTDSARYAAGARALAPESDTGNPTSTERAGQPLKTEHARRHSARFRRGARETAHLTDRPSAAELALDSTREHSAAAKQTDTTHDDDRSSSSQRVDEGASRDDEHSARAKPTAEVARSSSSKPDEAVETTASRTPPDQHEHEPSTRGAQAKSPRPVPTPRAASDNSVSESALLFEARKAMASDASVALRVLEDHARRYPHGALVPEREVLAIEALRALGRTTEADARLQRFEARYPDSLYLGRLRH